MTHKATVRLTANFEANLAAIEAWWDERGAPRAFDLLLDDLATTVIGNLERHPRMGRRFFARTPQSVEARDRVARLSERLGATEIREYLCGDYLLLYSVEASGRGAKAVTIVRLLAARHHRQLTFDFDAFWLANPDQGG